MMREMSDWNRQIIEEFRSYGGKVGGPFEGAPGSGKEGNGVVEYEQKSWKR
jgi:hypothetical protein